ncbi:hypothetical protein [Pilimelia columellifera]|uniref:Uncharacterized protein n=1 Tax=Pilimelia columellifera subsp. columellifera TaxID=706583 RepID=A0ABN3NHU2_9ACTN
MSPTDPAVPVVLPMPDSAVMRVWVEPARYGWTCTACRIGTFPQWSSHEAARADADAHTCTPKVVAEEKGALRWAIH